MMSTLAANLLYRHANSVAVAKIGLEVHAQLNIRSKLFSLGKNCSQGHTNSNLDYFDISLPGTLPVLNENAIKKAVLSSIGLNCEVQNVIHFDRKNYFYADMPAGFQVTQYNNPIARNGYIDFIVKAHHRSVIGHSQRYDVARYLYYDQRKVVDEVEPYIKRSHIKQIQLEQDSAKTLNHSSHDEQQELCTLVDYNRSGVALIEIVFEPDLSNHHEAASLIKELIVTLKKLDTCDCELQEGSLRVDANVSIQSVEGTRIDNSNRVELKNLNSLKALSRGINQEVCRQVELILQGQKVVQETRTYDSKTNSTILLRIKEDTEDYRYFPEPNIPPFRIEDSIIEEAKNELPGDLPSTLRKKLLEKYELDLSIASEILEEPGLCEYLINIVCDRRKSDINIIADFLIYSITNLKDIVSRSIEVDLTEGSEFLNRLSPAKMQSLFDMMIQDEISFATAYEVIKHIFITNDGSEPREIIEKFNWFQINDKNKIRELCFDLIPKMKNTSKKYATKGNKKYLRLMLEKLSEVTKNKVSIKMAIEVLNEQLKPPKYD